MTYFYKKGDHVARKEGGSPPSDTYVAMNQRNEIFYIKHGQNIESWDDIFPDDFFNKDDIKQYSEIERKNLIRLYAEDKAISIAKSVLLNSKELRTRKNIKPKSKRIPVKKCKCK